MTTKTKNILGWITAGLLAFVLAGAGISKLAGVEMQIKNLESWGYPLWMRYPIGLGEIVLSIGLLTLKFRKLATIGVFPWALIAIYTHIQAAPPQYQGIGAPIF